MNFNNFTFRPCALFTILALTNGFGHIFVLVEIYHGRRAALPSANFMRCQFYHIFQFYVENKVNIVEQNCTFDFDCKGPKLDQKPIL